MGENVDIKGAGNNLGTMPIEITKEKLILVEGVDEEKILERFFKIMEIKDIQVISMRGIPTSDKISTVKLLPNFEQIVKSFGIIRDADNDPKGKFVSVQNGLKDASLPVPSDPLKPIVINDLKVNIYIMPDGGKSPGMSETLFVESIKDDEIYQNCIAPFIACGESTVNYTLHEKSPAYAFIALQEEPDVRLGMSVLQKRWNLDHPVFDKLKEFIKSI